MITLQNIRFLHEYGSDDIKSNVKNHVDYLVHEGNRHDKIALLSYRMRNLIDSNHLNHLSLDEDPKIRLRVADHDKTDRKTLTKLALDSHDEVSDTADAEYSRRYRQTRTY